MAVATYDTQQNGTLTMSTDSQSLRIVSIGPTVQSVENIRTTYLANTNKHTWTPGELADCEEIQVVVQNSPGVNNPTLGLVQTFTITGPTPTGASAGESCTATGYVRSITVIPGYSSEQEGLQMKTFIVKFDGLTGPTRTPAS